MKNDLFELNITDINNDGEGVGKSDAFIWFVKDTVPGDHVLVSEMKRKKNYGYAKLQKVLEKSPDRCVAKCPVAKSCGGCNLQCMTYEAQLKFKYNKVLNNLKRIGGFANIENIMKPTIGMEEPWRYRNKAIVPFGRNKNGEVVCGFYAGHTHDIIECDDCLLGPAENAGLLKVIKDNYDDCIRHVLIKKGFATNQTMVCIVAEKKTFPSRDVIVKALIEMGITTVVLNINKEDTNVILGKEELILYGPGYIEDYIGKLKFRISAKSFYQVNPVQVEKLYGKAATFADMKSGETVWDLYCGIGTISLSLAQTASKVYGVEIVDRAIDDARMNARLNGIDNVEFYVGKAEEVLPREYERTGEKPDVIVVDPPRKGCDEVCLATMIKMSPKRIVYVSCDSATLARDLKVLCENGYELKEVQPVDMFSQTVHVETCALLTKASGSEA